MGNPSVQAALKYMCRLFNSSCSIQAKKENTFFHCSPVLCLFTLNCFINIDMVWCCSLHHTDLRWISCQQTFLLFLNHRRFVSYYNILSRKIKYVYYTLILYIFCSFMICPKSAELSSDLSIIHHLAIKHHQSNQS